MDLELFDSRPFWRPRDLAEVLQVSPSQVYRLIEEGDLDHVKVGQRAIRVPGASVAAYLQHPVEEPPVFDPEARKQAFQERTGHDPADFVTAWRAGDIPDTAENNQHLMEALALREAGVGARASAH